MTHRPKPPVCHRMIGPMWRDGLDGVTHSLSSVCPAWWHALWAAGLTGHGVVVAPLWREHGVESSLRRHERRWCGDPARRAADRASPPAHLDHRDLPPMARPVTPSARRGAALKQRKGATLVLVAVSISVLVAFAGLGMDAARMYAFVAQLKTAADAAALSAVNSKKNGQTVADAKTRALALRVNNRVNGADKRGHGHERHRAGQVGLQHAHLQHAGRRLERHRDECRPGPRALHGQLDAGPRLPCDHETLSQTSVAVLGSQATTSCVKPFAILRDDPPGAGAKRQRLHVQPHAC